jgi:hypothetical protein
MAQATTEAARRRRTPSARWRCQAFGLELDGGFPVLGLAHDGAPRSAAAGATLDLAAEDDLRRGFDGNGHERLREWYTEDGSLQGILERHEELGYLLAVDGYGSYRVSHDGVRIEVAPPAEEPEWRWQRCLIGQVLPLAALLAGYEVLHASAVSVGERAVAFVGATTAGKSSVAVNLVLRGAGFLTDDVLAVGASEGAVIGYPGAGIASVRYAEAQALGPERERLGAVLGEDGEAFRTLIERDAGARPLAGIYFLDRSGKSGIAIDPIPAPDLSLLLSSSFDFLVRTPQRLKTQLEICARMAEAVPMFWLRIPPSVTAADVASAVQAHGGKSAGPP